MKAVALLCAWASCVSLCGAAGAEDYFSQLSQAKKFAEEKSYKQSLQAYRNVLGMADASHWDFYSAACTAALSGEMDVAFNWLQQAIDRGWVKIDHTRKDSALVTLHTDPRWHTLLGLMQNKIDVLEKDYDKPLQQELENIFASDQNGRRQVIAVQERFGPGSKEVIDLLRTISRNDAENLQKVKAILEKHGWVGPDKVGERASTAIFLVIQHADLYTQKEYLPMLRNAVKNKKSRASALALLEDRVALREGRKQIYGSQITKDKMGIYQVSPLEDPDHVDQRRASMGLPPMAEYLRTWKLDWDLQAYKKSLEPGAGSMQ